MTELHTIIWVKPLEVGRLQVFFDDGLQPIIDLSPMLVQGGVFEPLRDPARFAAVEIADEGHALVWHAPSGIEDDDIDLSANALYLTATGSTFTLSAPLEGPRRER